jgi:hypothetical protein
MEAVPMADNGDSASAPDGIDWSLTTYEGNRRRQHEEFRALPLREKLARIEQMEAVAEHFSSRRPPGGKSR